jgi:predicted Zn-dependent protease
MPLLRKRKALRQTHDEVVPLLYEGLDERDARCWDFALVITATDLKSYYKPYSFAMVSQALAVGIISLARLVPQTLANDETIDSAMMAQRITALGLHLIGDLSGLAHSNETGNVMYQPDNINDLDTMKSYQEKQKTQLAGELADVADVRLEEQPQTQTSGLFMFYLKAIWHLRDDIFGAIIQARPWEFSFRLSRLTTAAISTLLVLIMTAEAWELGMSQPLLLVGLFSLVTLIATSAFILKRQKLLLKRSRQRRSEQTVITNTATVAIVLSGMATTYLILLTLVLLLSGTLFQHELVAGWAASLHGRIGLSNYLALAQMIAALGLIIGSLGASFEGQYYFQHVAYIDEEL